MIVGLWRQREYLYEDIPEKNHDLYYCQARINDCKEKKLKNYENYNAHFIMFL